MSTARSARTSPRPPRQWPRWRRGGWSWLLLCAALDPAHAATIDEHFPLTLDSGRTVQATVRKPVGAREPLPALMLFGGFRGAARVLERVRTERPVIWATFDYPFDPPRKFRFPSSLKHAPELRAAIHGTFDGVVKLHQALAARPDVDPARISVVGASAGAPFAVIGAADSPIPGVILVQGFSDDVQVIQNLLAYKYRERWGEWVRWPALWLAEWIHWYCRIPDIASYARRLRAGQQVLLITAADDQFVPRAASDALWSALQESAAAHERLVLPGGHLGIGDDTALIADLMQRTLRWLEQRRLL